MNERIINPGQILTGTLFNEPIRVETGCAKGTDTWIVGLVGTQSERFRSVTLSSRDIEALTIFDVTSTYDGDGQLLRCANRVDAVVSWNFRDMVNIRTRRAVHSK